LLRDKKESKMPLDNPMDTPVLYQCQSHRCRKRLYNNETISTTKLLGTRVTGRHSSKVLSEWIILTCPHCKETMLTKMPGHIYDICPFVIIEMPEYG